MADKYGEPPLTQGARFGDLERESNNASQLSSAATTMLLRMADAPFMGSPFTSPCARCAPSTLAAVRIGEFDAAMV